MDPVHDTFAAKWSNYLVAFVISAVMFATALLASSYFNGLRTADIRTTQDDISTQILSLQTQFELLQERSCADIAENTILPVELQTLADQLDYMESQSSTNKEEVLRLKRLYSLLEIKDYLLMKQLTAKCGLSPVFILYFYSNDDGACDQCEKQGYALTSLAQEYPLLRIYSFEYDLDVSALRTLQEMNEVRKELPALVIDGKVYYGYHSPEDIETILPQLENLKEAGAEK